MNDIKKIFTPFARVGDKTTGLVIAAWIGGILLLLEVFHSPIVPPPSKVFMALGDMMQTSSFWEDFMKSLITTVEAMAISIAITMVLVYASCIPAFRIFSMFVSKCRYLTLTGLVTLFTFFTSDLGQLKMSLLIFGIVPYFVTTFLQVVDEIPQQQIDKAYVNRKTSWEALYEVVIVGKMDALFEVMRENFAISWMMITMVEAYDMSGGGIGTIMIKSNRHLDLATIFAMLVAILGTGILFDFGLCKLRLGVFDYLKKKK